MRQHRPLHLSHLDAARTAQNVARMVHARANRDAVRLGMGFGLVDTKIDLAVVLERSRVNWAARTCADWAITGKGRPDDVAAALRELRADLEGVELGAASGREPDLSTAAGLVLVGAAARLALAEGRTVEATEVATLASVDERSIRAAAKAGTLSPVGTGRPMRFSADVACQYLYTRGVPGFEPPVEPTRGVG